MVNRITNPPSQKGVIDKINEVIDNIPTVNDATLTINQGGVQKGTFTANAASNVTIDLDAGGGSDINLVGVAPITVTETQAGGATNIDTSNGYIKNTYDNLTQNSYSSLVANLRNSTLSNNPSTVKELFTGNVSYFDVPTNFGERATAGTGSLVSDVLTLGGYTSLNANYYPVVMWGVLEGEDFTPVIYQKGYATGTSNLVLGYVDSVATGGTNSINLTMAVAETSPSSVTSSVSASYAFTVSKLANNDMKIRFDRYSGSSNSYIERQLTQSSAQTIYTNFLKINCARVFLKGNSNTSYLPTVNDTTLTKDGTVTSWKVTDTSQAGLTIGINIDSTPTSASTNAITSGGVYTELGNKQDTLVSGTNIKTINSTSLLGSGNIDVQSVIDANNKLDYAYLSNTPTIPEGLPSQTGHSGDVLTTDGTDASWADTTTVYPVIETYINGTSWYRIYAPDSTGYRWCEMGDLYYKGSTTAGDNTINFLKNFKDLNFGFTPTPLHSTANLNQYQMYEKYPDRTVSSVNLHVTAAVFGYSWTAEGYIANEV